MIQTCWLLIAFGAISVQAGSANTLNRCFQRITRRAIDNYQPLAEYQMESLEACADYCVMAAGNRERKEPLCRSFTYSIPQKTCLLYDHDGMKVPAISYPTIGIDFYKRVDADEVCKGNAAFTVNNPNFATIGPADGGIGLPNQGIQASAEIESYSEPLRNQDIPNEIAHAVDRDLKLLQKKTSKELSTINKSQEDVPRSEICSTSNAYYVVIGNEIARPMSNGGTVKVYNDVDQGDCASFCSNNQGPNEERLVCNSLNYFPITRKCELYSILAEPHGPGSLVENQDVIYAEKFCLPESMQTCQKDEIFILHVQKSLSGIPIQQTSSDSITSCLQSCLNAYACKTAVFDSTKQQCHMYNEKVSKSERSIVDTPPGFVMIENGCIETKTNAGHTRPFKNLKADSSSEWSDCNFRINGMRVKVRTTENGRLETSTC
ncbi:hypothetical protein Aduo_018113 [Ancylostoma duodenale]